MMIIVNLQGDEADIAEKLVDIVLTNPELSGLIFKDGKEKRSARRVSKKLHWAKSAANQELSDGSTPDVSA